MDQNLESIGNRRQKAGRQPGHRLGLAGLGRILGLASLLVFLRPIDAWAYVDPGTGSYLLQMIIAGLLATAVAVRMFWTNVKLFVRRLFNRSGGNESDPNPPSS